jgi:hypothetical protein
MLPVAAKPERLPVETGRKDTYQRERIVVIEQTLSSLKNPCLRFGKCRVQAHHDADAHRRRHTRFRTSIKERAGFKFLERRFDLVET